MRFARSAALGFLVVMLAMPSAWALDSTNARNFGSTNCQQKFSCSGTDSNQIVIIANDCSVRGFGISTQQTGIFDGASLDSNNCLAGELTSKNSTTMTPQCCIIADGDNCSMRCTLYVQ